MSLFTPLVAEDVHAEHERAYGPESVMDDGRIRLDVAPDDLAAFDALPPYGAPAADTETVVTDATGRAWIVRRAACGAGCACAAEAEPLPDEPDGIMDPTFYADLGKIGTPQPLTP